MNERTRVFLIAYGATAETALRSLVASVNVVGVLRDTSDPADPVVLEAKRRSLPLFTTALTRDLGRLIAESRADCVVVSSYNRIIGSDLRRNTPFINVHYAPLPAYRGRAPVNWAIINGETEAAITFHLIDDGLDSGNIIFQEKISISAKDSVTDLYQRLNMIQEQQLGTVVLRVMDGFVGMPQNHSMATYGCTRLPQDGEIEWNCSSVEIDRLVRALAPPFPGAFTYFSGRPVIVRRAEPVQNLEAYAGRIPGRVIRLSRVEGWVDVLAGDGAVRIYEVELERKGFCRAVDIFGSTRATLGFRTEDLHRILAEISSRIEDLEKDVAQLRSLGV